MIIIRRECFHRLNADSEIFRLILKLFLYFRVISHSSLPEVINRIIEGYRSSGKGIVIPVYKDKRGHPLLIDRKYRNEIEMLDDREGLRSLSHKFPDDVLEVDTDDPGILRDFDTYEEYEKEINQKM